MGLDLEFEIKCRVGLSPTTVLPMHRRFSNVESRTRRSKFTRRDELLTIDENFTEMNFVKYRSASCKNDVSSNMKRGSVYQSSNEVRQMKEIGVFEERREKIEISHGINEEGLKKKRSSSGRSRNSGLSKSSVSESLMDNFASDEFFEIRLKGGECVERGSNADQNLRCGEVVSPQNDANELPEFLPKSLSSRAFQNHRFRPIIKMFDPFAKSKSLRSPLGGVVDLESRVKPEPQAMKKSHHSNTICSPVHLNGRLKVEKKHGTPFYEFTLNSPGEVFVAKTRKVENSFNWLYTFYFTSNKRHKESSVAGQMKVSCYLSSEKHDEASDSSVMVNEFVLYDASHLRKSFADEERRDLIQADLSHLRPNHEIAAIVIESPFEKRESLKNKNNNEKSHKIKDMLVTKKKKKKIARPTRMNVVIPSGIHGSVPKEDNRGPSCLLERWRSNGGCECGGWDMGCPLAVFSGSTIRGEEDRLSAKNPWPLDIHIQGTKEKAPALRMSFTEEGNYSVDFHAQLSTLQAFSICVAVLHNLDPSSAAKHEESNTRPTLQCISLKELLVRDEVKFLVSDEEKRDMFPSFVPNLPFSPIARV